MIRYCFTSALFLGAALSSAHASCPQSFAQTDTALWQDARNSGQPARWVQYYVSAQCQENKAAARALLVPILGDPDRPGSSALDQVRYTGLFSGAQGNPVEEARNGSELKSTHNGAELFTFQLYSNTKVSVEIPQVLYRGLPEQPQWVPKNTAVWLRYRCKFTNTHAWSGWYDDPPADPAHPNCSQSNYTIEAIETQVMGPYAQFFQNPSVLTQPAGIGGAATLTLTLRLKPEYASFMGMLTGNFVR